jgi:hypothetical protein
LQDAEKQNHESWDSKFEDMLWQLQDYQEEKDHPQAQVVNIEVDELYNLKPLFYYSKTNVLIQLSSALQVLY